LPGGNDREIDPAKKFQYSTDFYRFDLLTAPFFKNLRSRFLLIQFAEWEVRQPTQKRNGSAIEPALHF